MPVSYADIKTGKVDLDSYAISHGSLHTRCAPDPQAAINCPRCDDNGMAGGCPRCGE